MVPGLLRRDPPRQLKALQPARIVPGHHITPSQVDVMMASPHRRHPRPEVDAAGTPHRLFSVFKLDSDGYLMLGNVRRPEGGP
jgi:hypothetical protein